MTDDDPNESYEMVPIDPGPHGPPEGWWNVKRNGLPDRVRWLNAGGCRARTVSR